MNALHFSAGPMVLALPRPSAKRWAPAADRALSAPEHGGSRPHRLLVVGDCGRDALAYPAAVGAQQRGQSAHEAERIRVRAFNGAGLAVLVAHVHDVPPHEQWLRVGAALIDCLSASQLMGFVAGH